MASVSISIAHSAITLRILHLTLTALVSTSTLGRGYEANHARTIYYAPTRTPHLRALLAIQALVCIMYDYPIYHFYLSTCIALSARLDVFPTHPLLHIAFIA